MTGDELAARVFTEQGFYVLPSDRVRTLGEICLKESREPVLSIPVDLPFRVIGFSNKQESDGQRILISRILGEELPFSKKRYFYRVEAAD